MGSISEWRLRQLERAAHRFEGNPWRYSARTSLYMGPAMFGGTLLGGASVSASLVNGVIAMPVWLLLMRYWFRPRTITRYERAASVSDTNARDGA